MTTVERVELGSHAKTVPAAGDAAHSTPAPPVPRQEVRALNEIAERLATGFPDFEREAHRALAHADPGPRR